MSFTPSFGASTGSNRMNINPSASFGRDLRFDLKTKVNPVGPGKYGLDGGSPAKGGVFSKDPRFSKNSRNVTPDHYRSAASFEPSANGKKDVNRVAQSFGKSQRFNGTDDNSISPGPQYYNPLKTNAGPKMGKSNRFKKEIGTSANIMGPNYMPPSMTGQPSKALKMGKATRFSASAGSQLGGAGSYVPSSTLAPTGAPRFSKAERFGKSSKGGSNVTDAYNPQSFSNIGTNRSSVNMSAKWGKSDRFSSDKPGNPGKKTFNYNPKSFEKLPNGKSQVNPDIAFSKAKRFTAHASSSSTPGPVYSPPYMGRSPSTVKIGHGRRFSNGKQTTPGPAYVPPGIERQTSFVKWKPPKKPRAQDYTAPGYIMPEPIRTKSAAVFGTAPRFSNKGQLDDEEPEEPPPEAKTGNYME